MNHDNGTNLNCLTVTSYLKAFHPSTIPQKLFSALPYCQTPICNLTGMNASLAKIVSSARLLQNVPTSLLHLVPPNCLFFLIAPSHEMPLSILSDFLNFVGTQLPLL